MEVTVEAYAGESFPGTVTFINPFLDDKTRTVKARVNLANAQKKLKPEMYASASIRVKLQADGTPEPTGLEGKFICPMHPDVVKEKEGKCPLCKMPRSNGCRMLRPSEKTCSQGRRSQGTSHPNPSPPGRGDGARKSPGHPGVSGSGHRKAQSNLSANQRRGF